MSGLGPGDSESLRERVTHAFELFPLRLRPGFVERCSPVSDRSDLASRLHDDDDDDEVDPGSYGPFC